MRLYLLAALLLFTACTPAAPSGRPVPQADTIAATDLDVARHPTLDVALRVVRPHWLASRSVSTGESVLVEVNGAMMAGGLAALRHISTRDVQQVTRVNDGTTPRGVTVLRIRLRT